MAGLGDLFEIPDLRKRIGFTLGAIAAFRVGASVPIPGVNATTLRAIFNAQSNGVLDFLNTFSGGAFSRFSILSLSVLPYISASIIIRLLEGARIFPIFDRLAEKGEFGRRTLDNYTRYLTLMVGIIQSFGITFALANISASGEAPVVVNAGFTFYFRTVLTLVAGAIFAMWLADEITESGIGNGVALIIFAGLIAPISVSVLKIVSLVRTEQLNLFLAGAFFTTTLAFVVFVVWLETGVRRVTVTYAKRMVGRRMYGGSQSYLPINVERSGVAAVVSATALIHLPLILSNLGTQTAFDRKIADIFGFGSWIGWGTYAALVIFFGVLYSSNSLRPQDLADNLRKSGGFVPGIRPGEPTANYIERVGKRVSLGGAAAVALLAILPDILRRAFNLPIFFGGATLIIVVGVALDTLGQIESELILRRYDGFLKKGRYRGFYGDEPGSQPSGRPVRPKSPPPSLEGGAANDFPPTD